MVIIDFFKNFFKSKDVKKGPWASFSVTGFESDGRVKIEMDWNDEFITKAKALGFEAETDQDIVQLFFYTSQMRPAYMGEDPESDPISPAAHPNLSNENHSLRI